MPLQRAVDRITALLGRPRSIGVLTAIAAGWISLNLLAAALGYGAIDPAPFPGLGLAVSLVSLYIVVLILATSGVSTNLPTPRAAHFGVGDLDEQDQLRRIWLPARDHPASRIGFIFGSFRASTASKVCWLSAGS
jgi:hypothetical protein